MESVSPPSTKNDVLLKTLESKKNQTEVENMNLKMEVAHLRERIFNLTGSDPSSISLEKENFELKSSIRDLESELQEQNKKFVECQQMYKKSIKNLVKLDKAWKDAIKLYEEEKNLRETSEAASLSFKKRYSVMCLLWQKSEKELEKRHHESLKINEQMENNQNMLHDEIQTHLASLKAMKKDYDLLLNDNTALKKTLATKEAHYERDIAQDHQSIHDMEGSLQKSNEECAFLRGRNTALEKEITILQDKVAEFEVECRESKTRCVELIEKNATQDLHFEALKKTIERYEKKIDSSQQEIDRYHLSLRDKEDSSIKMLDELGKVNQSEKETLRAMEMLKQEVQHTEVSLIEKQKKMEEQIVNLQECNAQLERQLQQKSLEIDQLDAVKKEKENMEKKVSLLDRKMILFEKQKIEMEKLVLEKQKLDEAYKQSRQAMERIIKRREKQSTFPSMNTKENPTPVVKCADKKRKLPESSEQETKCSAKRVFVKSRYMNSYKK